MVPRSRKKENADLKGLNLYPDKKGSVTYYRFKHPTTGKWHPMGTDRAQAKAAARILMDRLAPGSDLVQDVLMGDDITVSKLIELFESERLPTMKLAAGTEKNYRYRLNRIKRDIGAKGVRSQGIGEISAYLDDNFTRDAYVKHRSTLIDLFRFAKVKGRYPAEADNPAEVAYAKADVEKVRQRLTLAQFKAIHAIAPHYMQIAMELSLVTLQGRFEVCHMEYDHIVDNHLHVIREKTKANEWARIRIPVTPTIDDIVKRSRSDAVASPFIIHRRPGKIKSAAGRTHWTQVVPHWFSKEFRKYRDNTGLFNDLGSLERPTFHEIRALGSWLYEQAGFDVKYVQGLMTHGDEKMTEHYQSGHAEKWMDVRADLELKEVLG